MTGNLQDMLEMVDESFLRNEEKQILKEELEKEGPSEVFFATMNTFCISELEKRSNTYEKVIESFETRYGDLENEYKNKKKELDDELDNNISKVDLVNLATKEKIFDQYYQNTETMQTNYEKGVHELYSRLSVAIIKGMGKDEDIRDE